LLGSFINAIAQITISGNVLSISGDPLPGATVTLQNSTLGTSTNTEGFFIMNNIPQGKYTMAVSFVGFETHTRSINVEENINLSISLEESITYGDEIIVYATRANKKTPTTYSNLNSDDIAERNLGQDLPILLNFTPSMVTTSDAGAGVGYTGMRIRGSDGTRINVTINGIPVNDSESHGVWWVNMPDLATSLNQIQIQRGVGTSSNGAAAFGAAINMQTSEPSRKSFGEINGSVGSFNTWKSNVVFNTGLIKDKFNFEGRLSRIGSDGYIDRSRADLSSYFLTGGYYGDKTTLKAVVFGGKEITYQSWYGTPQARIENDEEGLQNVILNSGEYNTQEQKDNLWNSDRRFNYYLYDNEVDNYSQNHFQLHLNHTFTNNFNLALSGHYTYGRGYFEQERIDDDFSDYNLEDVVIGEDTITSTDIIRRRWLDNDFYGLTYAFNFNNDNLALTLGGSYNEYIGDHFGEIIWAEIASNSSIRERYYDGVGEKSDLNTYIKVNYQATARLNLFADMQFRFIDFTTVGVDNDLVNYDTGGNFTFLNPKLGLTHELNGNATLYGSYARGNREPVRSDFIDAPNGMTPKYETLNNIELGIKSRNNKLGYEANFYYMGYKNQLVLTGALNDVGASIRTNVPDSYRAGIELSAAYSITQKLNWSFNAAFSQNKIKEYTETVYDYAFSDERYIVEIIHKDTDISFSPNVIIGSNLAYSTNGFAMQLLSKYVGKQFLDNTSNEDRIIESYFINDVNFSYNFAAFGMENIGINLLINNIFNIEYQSNGYTWGYLWDGELYQQNNYYPQAGINFLAGINLRF
jgi:iron complex outermembrane receptor protein